MYQHSHYCLPPWFGLVTLSNQVPQTAIWLPRLFIIVDRECDRKHEDGGADDADRDDGICEDS